MAIPALFVVGLVALTLVGLVVVGIVVLSRSGSGQQGKAEDLEALRDLARDMRDLDHRMDNVETVLRRDDS